MNQDCHQATAIPKEEETGVLLFLKHVAAGLLVLIEHLLLMLLLPRVKKENMEGHYCHDESDENVIAFPLQN